MSSQIKVVKAYGIAHRDEKKSRTVLYSASMHPRRPIMATGGIDAHVRIWNLCPDKSTAECGTELLSSLSLHNGAVLCVRFSPDGQYLASSSDGDNVVIIWEQQQMDSQQLSSSSFKVFGSDEVNQEQWRCRIRLNKHISDVVDLAWSPPQQSQHQLSSSSNPQSGGKSQYLASCGLDGKVIVYDTEVWSTVKVINGHSNFVKGVCWDPTGSLLCSFSDDGSGAVWNAIGGQFELVRRIKEPFKRGFSNGFFRRGAWSPDGQNLAMVQANDQSGLINSVSVSKRSIKNVNGQQVPQFEEEASLIGHTSASECCAFNPWLFKSHKQKSKSSNSDDGHWLLAIGSQDGSVSFWQSNRSRASLVLNNLYESCGIYDIGWCSDGSVCYCVGADGVITFILLSTNAQHQSQVRKDSLNFNMFLTRQNAMESDNQSFSRIVQTIPSSLGLVTPFGIIAEQALIQRKIEQFEGFAEQQSKEADMKDLALQEFPHLAAQQGALVDDSTPKMGGTAQQGDITLGGASLPQITKLDRLQMILDGGSAAQTSNRLDLQFPSINNHQQQHPTTAFQKMSRVKPSQSSSQAVNVLSMQKMTVTKDGKKRVQPFVVSSPQQNKYPQNFNQIQQQSSTVQSSNHSAVIIKRVVADSPLNLQPVKLVGKLKIEFIYNITGQTRSIEVQQLQMRGVSKLQYQAEDILHSWSDYIPQPVLVVTTSDDMLVACLTDCTIIVWSHGGRRLLPVIKCDSQVHQCAFAGKYHVWFISVKGALWVWNIKRAQCIMDGISLSSIIKKSNTVDKSNYEILQVIHVDVAQNERVSVHLSDFTVMIYDYSLHCWTAVLASNDFQKILEEPVVIPKKQPLDVFKNAVDSLNQIQKSSVYRSNDIRLSAQLQQAECLLNSCRLNSDCAGYNKALLQYANTLSQAGDMAIARTQELIDDLLSNDLAFDGELDGAEALKHIFPILAKNYKLQPIVQMNIARIENQQRLSDTQSFVTANQAQ
ncbi:hypothetical protein MP228_008803 [Amoeboaphelidium protococcarum]|nr:hypothetical protein MP228_008803 [Amoeboaphelidium protococcarum]